jgi:hypothetical protein
MLKKGRHASHAQDLGAYSRKSEKNKTTPKHLSPNLSALCERSVENTATSVAEEAKKSVCANSKSSGKIEKTRKNFIFI